MVSHSAFSEPHREHRSKGRFIGIIGAGFAGTILALRLLERAGSADHIYLFEKELRAGPGIAYSSWSDRHLLNVCASNMSAFSDQPGHFTSWLSRHADGQHLPDIGPGDFAPRWVYGRYLEDLLANALQSARQSGRLVLVQDEAVSIEENAEALRIDTVRGYRFHMDAVILATGNTPAGISDPHIDNNPWSPALTAGIRTEDDVLLLGTGLTMVDTVLSLREANHTGHIYAVSRHGLLPRRQNADGASTGVMRVVPPIGLSPASLLHWLRQACNAHAAKGGDWRDVVSALRPYTQSIWMSWSLERQASFLRHARSIWDVHRHRMAPKVADQIAEAIEKSMLHISSGRIRSIRRQGRMFNVVIERKGAENIETLTVGRIIDCTGIKPTYKRQQNSLLGGLIEAGIGSRDALGLGLNVDESCAVINISGQSSSGIFAVGPLTRGTFWETIAVPDIRVQCEELADRLIPANHRSRKRIA